MTTYAIRAASSFTHTVREIKGGRKTGEDGTVASPAFTIVIAAKTAMVEERSVDIGKTGIRDLRWGSDETRAVITLSVLVMAVRAPG